MTNTALNLSLEENIYLLLQKKTVLTELYIRL